MNTAKSPVVAIESVTHRYKKTVALDDITVRLPAGIMV